jgi:hypothetical protein
MIDPEVVESFNARLTVGLSEIKKLPPGRQDQVKNLGSQAEALLSNKHLAMFIHQYKFELCDELASITGHTDTDNARRIAISHQIAGIENFVVMLQKAVFIKSRVVTHQNAPTHQPESNLQ